MKGSRRLALVIHSLEGGGAERTLALLANRWVASGRQVTLITLCDGRHDAYPLHDRVERVALSAMRDSKGVVSAVRNNVHRIRLLRQAIAEAAPDCVIAFTPTINVLTLRAAPRQVPVVIAERVDPRRHEIGRLWNTLRNWTYPRCAKLVVQTSDVRRYFLSCVKAERIEVIGNSIVGPQQSPPAIRDREPVILGVGRLDRQKGFDMLLQAFSEIASEFPDWRLRIHGEGDQRESLERQVESLKLGERVTLPGWREEIRDAYREAAVFALSSRYEGFPNALLEAMSEGAAVVAMDCPSGPGEIVRDEVDGLLTPDGDVASLAAALRRLLEDESLRARLGAAAREVSDRFSQETFFTAWDRVVDLAIATHQT